MKAVVVPAVGSEGADLATTSLDEVGNAATAYSRPNKRGSFQGGRFILFISGQKLRFLEYPENGFAWCGNAPTSQETVFKLSRGAQQSYIEKIKKKYLKNNRIQ